MTPSHKLILVIVVLLTLGLSISASAVQVAQKTTYFTGTLASGQGLACNAVVDYANGFYTYSYTLNYTAGVGTIHTLDIDNPNEAAFTYVSAGNGFAPVLDYYPYPSWDSGNIAVHNSCTFVLKSMYAPMPDDMLVLASVVDGGNGAEGWTLGMSNAVPEPSCLVAVLFGAAGLVPVVIRRRK